MIWHGHIDLPAELDGKLPRLLTEAIVSLAGIAVAVGMRLAIQSTLGDVVPFALTFPVLLFVVLIAGLRAGLMALVGCQLLIWYHILPYHKSFVIADLTTGANLVLTTLAQLVLLWAVESYRRAVRTAMAASEARIEGLSLALREIDHRTRNNFQLAIALLSLQARGSEEPEVSAGLEKAATRLQAIASIYANLAISSASLGEIRLHDHLGEICNRLREGLLPATVRLEHAIEPMIVSQDMAVRIGLVVNELVTNAAKHAFPDGIGTIRVTAGVTTGGEGRQMIEVIVGDDGCGHDNAIDRSAGLGSNLVRMLCRQLGARFELARDEGTRCHLHVPVAG